MRRSLFAPRSSPRRCRRTCAGDPPNGRPDVPWDRAMAYLLWQGRLPNRRQLQRFARELAGYRELPPETRAATELAAKRMGPMDALRFAVASLTADDGHPDDRSPEAELARAGKLLARI